MSQQQPTKVENEQEQPSSTSLESRRAQDFIKFKRYAAWTFIVASPILIALPPRKFDLYTVALTGAFIGSANHLYRERRGVGILDDLFRSRAHTGADGENATSGGIFSALPTEKAQRIQSQLRAQREAALSGEELERYRQQRDAADRSILERIWMGSETEGWKERRLREEQRALSEGKGYGDLIMDHIREVWNWGKKDDASKADKTRDSKGSET
ncbi:hypothetical protein VTN31DRAFT_3025 [Thermomyces dupontii]|uniref:uncharacterized protein n=1 Tax=Talaromyces thermophilus TaxID=28565 RepID=UPI0037439653